VRLRNLVIEGTNLWAFQAGRNPRDMQTHSDDDADNSMYLSPPPPNAPRLQRNSPYAGICIDPFWWELRRDPDPSRSERYPGISDDLYDKRHIVSAEFTDKCERVMTTSTHIQIDHCVIRGFVTGIVVSPTGITREFDSVRPANAENIRISHTTIESTLSAIAIGQDQSRHVVLSDVNIFGAKFAINCVDHGFGSGNTPSIFGAKMAGVKYLFNVNNAGSACAIHGLHAEDFLAIGELFGPTDYDPHVFDGCHFRFGAAPKDRPIVNAHLYSLTQAVFHGCTFERLPEDTDPITFFTNDGTLTFAGCRFHVNRPGPPFWVTNQEHRVAYKDCVITTALDTPPFFQAEPFSEMQTTVRPVQSLPGSFHAMTDAILSSRLYWTSGAYPRIELGSGPLEVRPGGRAVFTMLRASLVINKQEPVFDNIENLLRPGDLFLIDEEQTVFVSNIAFPQANGDTLDGKIVVGVFDDGTPIQEVIEGGMVTRKVLPLVRVPIRLRSMPLVHLRISYFPRVHPVTYGDALGERITGISTAGVPLQDAWRAGDRIRGEGIVPGTYIKAIDAARGEITLSTSARKAGRLLLFDAPLQEVLFTKD
jgi:hypothetical protein